MIYTRLLFKTLRNYFMDEKDGLEMTGLKDIITMEQYMQKLVFHSILIQLLAQNIGEHLEAGIGQEHL